MTNGTIFEDEDMFDDSDDGDDEDEESALEGNPISQIREVKAKLHKVSSALKQQPAAGKPRNVRMRPMPPQMAQKHPDVTVITMTRKDGRQLIFVRN